MDKKANRFIQKCPKSLKLQQHFSRFQLTRHAPPLEVIRGHWNQHRSIGYLLTISDHRNLGPTSYRLCDKKAMIAIFFLSVYLTSPRGGSLWNFVTTVGSKKLE